MADQNFYQSSYGGLRLWLSRLSTDVGRSQVRHEPSAGDDYVIQDRGEALLVASASVLFDWMDGDTLAPLERLQRLRALVDDQSRVFSHPVEGSFLARVGPFKYEINESGVITADVEFARVSEVRPVTPVGPGGIPASGESAVNSAADALDAELEAIGMSTPTTAAARTAVEAWATSDNVNPRDVLAQTGSLTSQLGSDAAGMEDDTAMWSAYKATILLAETIRIAAQASTASTGQTFALRIGAPIALRALVASIYPAAEADRRYSEIMQINDIVTPAWLDVGTQYELPLPTSALRV